MHTKCDNCGKLTNEVGRLHGYTLFKTAGKGSDKSWLCSYCALEKGLIVKSTKV